MTRLERRQASRMTVEGFAYINIEPNNGGSVLNVSEDGLCFHSIAPIPRDRPVRFWFSEQDRRIEGVGEVAWMDEPQKTAGVRFTSLSAEAREQIRRWTTLSVVPPLPDKQPRVFSALGSPRPDAKAAASPSPIPMVLPKPAESIPLSPFSRGLLTGLLVAVVVTAGFTVHAYRQEFGEWLIHLGQQFAPSPQVQAQSPAQPVLPAQLTASAAQPSGSSLQQSPPPATHPVPPALAGVSPAPAPQPEKPILQSSANPAKADPAPAITPVVVRANSPKPPATNDAPATSPAPPALSSNAPALNSDVVSGKVAELPQLAVVTPPPASNPPNDHAEVTREESGKASTGPPPEMYFEVGRSKDPAAAHETSDKLEQLGFPSSVTQKGRLWSNNYVVLVGPYSDEAAAEAADKDLLSQNFRPRPFERGTRDISLRPGLTLNGARIPEGDCTVSWESYVTGTVVKVLQDHLLVTTVNGRWEKSPAKYRRDAFVYRKNVDGTKTLLEIQFAGMTKSLVFNKTS